MAKQCNNEQSILAVFLRKSKCESNSILQTEKVIKLEKLLECKKRHFISKIVITRYENNINNIIIMVISELPDFLKMIKII